MQLHNPGKIRIFGCGGCGINLAKILLAQKGLEGMADLDVSLIDTSYSNVTDKDQDKFFLISEEGEGSGKVRRDNAGTISDNIRSCLMTHEAAGFNVVIFSASGGSGSVIGPLLMKELLDREIPVIGIVVGSSESSITATNTLNTIKSLSALGQQCDKPMVISYTHNSRDVKRSEVDEIATATALSLAVLNSQRNDELDQRDVRNWVFYNHGTSVNAQLSILEVCRTEDAAKKVGAPISVASLLTDKDAPAPEIYPEYSCIGYHDGPILGQIDEVHYLISVNGIGDLVKMREEDVAKFQESTLSRTSPTKNLMADTDVDAGTGLVL